MTADRSPPIILAVTRRAVRTLNTCVAIGSLLGLAWLPQEHLHRSHAEDGHHASVTHRHYEAHPARETHPAIDDQDIDVEWIDARFTATPLSTPTQPLLALLPDRVVCIETSAAERGWALRRIPASVHDPPWISASGPRAPPFLPA